MSNFKIGRAQSARPISKYELDYSLNCSTQDPIIINRMYNKFRKLLKKFILRSSFLVKTSVTLFLRVENCRKHCKGSR